MSFNEKSHENLEVFENNLKTALFTAPTLHADETGVRVNAKTNRIHTASTSSMTYYFPHEKRGKEAMDAMGILLSFIGNLISDHWKSYEFYSLLTHYFCNAHHLRELTWVFENEEKKWAKEMRHLLAKSK
jgi:transposase